MPEQAEIEPTEIRTLTTPPGGIMTSEVGAITGPVEVWLDDDHVRIRYEGAIDTYTVIGAAATRSLDDLVTLLTRDPGVDQHGNSQATSLKSQLPPSNSPTHHKSHGPSRSHD